MVNTLQGCVAHATPIRDTSCCGHPLTNVPYLRSRTTLGLSSNKMDLITSDRGAMRCHLCVPDHAGPPPSSSACRSAQGPRHSVSYVSSSASMFCAPHVTDASFRCRRPRRVAGRGGHRSAWSGRAAGTPRPTRAGWRWRCIRRRRRRWRTPRGCRGEGVRRMCGGGGSLRSEAWYASHSPGAPVARVVASFRERNCESCQTQHENQALLLRCRPCPSRDHWGETRGGWSVSPAVTVTVMAGVCTDVPCVSAHRGCQINIRHHDRAVRSGSRRAECCAKQDEGRARVISSVLTTSPSLRVIYFSFQVLWYRPSTQRTEERRRRADSTDRLFCSFRGLLAASLP